MIRTASFIEEWMLEREEKGRTEGRTEEARELTQTLLAERFGSLPEDRSALIQNADEAWCRQLLARLLKVTSVEELLSH